MEPLQPRHVAANLHHTRRRPDESRSWLSSTTFSPRSFAREAMSGSTREQATQLSPRIAGLVRVEGADAVGGAP
jgi:hypothetical protein